MRKATEAQVKKWPELAAYRGNILSTWRENNPEKGVFEYPGLPYMILVILEVF
jgi:hypothetical protein